MLTKKKLSIRQEGMLEFIGSFLAENGLPPTVRDIQFACQISSTSVVDYNLRLLQRDGYLRRRPDVARGIELVHKDIDNPQPVPRIPVIGYIAAGQPLPTPPISDWAAQEPIESLQIPKQFIRSKTQLYALRVKGTSMIDALIDDGDLVLVEPVNEIKDGDMVVAWLRLEQEATLKRIYREGSMVRLQPANSEMHPIFVRGDNVEVHGKVAAVLRTP